LLVPDKADERPAPLKLLQVVPPQPVEGALALMTL